MLSNYTQDTQPLIHQSSELSSYIEINQRSWQHNIVSYKHLLPAGVQLGVVLKSNAYGHGLTMMAALAEAHDFVDCILVVSCTEAVHLRSTGIKKNIIVLSILDEYLEQALLQACAVVVYSQQSVMRVVHYAQRNALKASIHVKIDTGLSRLGIPFEDAPSFVRWISSFDCLSIAGIFTHFSDAEQTDHSFLHEQQRKLTALIDHYVTLYKHPIVSHSACTAAIGRAPATHGSLVRLGIGSYGLWPSAETKQHLQALYPHFYLQPVLAWKSRILQIKSIRAGSAIGYDKTFIAHKPMTIGILPVGYYDGLNRALSNKGCVMINGQIAPIVGRVSMNLTIIDITTIQNINTESIVDIIGNHDAISLETQAQKCGTITYELATHLGAHLRRVYS